MIITMLVASHKNCRIPEDLSVYTPILVGSAFHEGTPVGFIRDDQGDNISDKNPRYNELTALYWGWKNLSSDYVGLVQYRRYFVSGRIKGTDKFKNILTRTDLEKLVAGNKIIVPKKRHYYIETIESHYCISHSADGMKALKVIFSKMPKNYRLALNHVLSSKSAHMFNMFIMERSEFSAYSSWLFDVLFKVEKELNYEQLQGNEKRALGFLSEIMLDVWLTANDKVYKEVPVSFMEKQHWVKKISIFLLNKISGGRWRLNTHIK